LIGPNTKEDPAERTCQDRCPGEQAKLGIGQAEVLLNLNAEDRENRPNGEAHGEGHRAHAQDLGLLSGGDVFQGTHMSNPSFSAETPLCATN